MLLKIGLFGGSFDPVHLGRFARGAGGARRNLSLDRLFLSRRRCFYLGPGSGPAPANERLRLLRLALAGQTWAGVDDQEITRGGVSYSIDTLRDYARRFAGATLYYLVGADNVAQLPQ